MYIAFVVGAALFALIVIGLIFARLYKRASKEISFVRTGFGGQKVIMNGGALVFPVLHEIIPVNMNTLRLEVFRANEEALITRDRMRVDVKAEFYVRVKPIVEAIADAAQTLGRRTMDPKALKELVEGKFVDALRAVAAEMAMEELHEQRVDFVQKVQAAVMEDLLKNGMELESVSLTALDQTDQSYFNPQNAFDAQGLTKLTEEIEERKKQRNDIERDTQVAIELKNLEAEKKSLQIARETDYAKLTQQREVEVRKAEEQKNMATERAEKKREADEADIVAQREVELARITAERAIEEEKITKERMVKERDIERQRTIETAEIDRKKTVELSDQDRAIAIANKTKDQSVAEAEADKARALAVTAEEQVTTARETEAAERQKAIELVEARKQAERDAIEITLAAEAEKQAAVDQAEAMRTIADGEGSKVTIAAKAQAEAVVMQAEADEKRYAVEADGQRGLHEAENVLDGDIIAMRLKLALIENLDKIVRESVKPIEAIDGIKIIQVDGLNPGSGNGGGNGDGGSNGGGNLAEQVVSSALRYRGQAPLIDSLMNEIGLSGGDLNGLVAAAQGDKAEAPAAIEERPQQNATAEVSQYDGEE
jgi:uncharacterized membrane protein YqiK